MNTICKSLIRWTKRKRRFKFLKLEKRVHPFFRNKKNYKNTTNNYLSTDWTTYVCLEVQNKTKL